MIILSKLGPDYSLFFSTFYATKLTAQTWKMPNIAEFMESLTQEQDKLVMMGTIKPSKDQALVAPLLSFVFNTSAHCSFSIYEGS